jgi:TPR repeat protein
MSPKYLVAAALIGWMGAPATAQSVKAGIEAWQHANYASAVAIWRPLADRGDADAQFNLGQAYRLGRGVPLNLGTAKGWFERAARTGHVDAETTLGLLMFENGEQPEGLKWLRQAADRGEPRAQLVYGTALYNGDGITQDHILGYAYVRRAADQGLGPAKDTLDQLDKILPAGERQKGAALARVVPQTPPPQPKAAAAPKSARTAQPKLVPKLVEQRPAPSPATGGWRIQLGAFSQRAGAEALYQRLSVKSALAGRSPYYIPVGSMTRLQAGPFASRAAAAAACSALGTACFPVPAK